MEKASENEILNRVYTMKGGADEVRDVYKDWAENYEKDTVQDMGYVAPVVVAGKLAAVAPDASVVLDAGCGTGLAGVELAKRGFETVDGMDISPEMLDIAREKDVYRALQTADMTGPLSYDTNAYDAVTCVGTFTHAHVGPMGFDELLRITKPSGLVIATVHEDVWDDGYEAHFEHLEAVKSAEVKSIEEAPYHLHGCRLCVLQPLAA